MHSIMQQTLFFANHDLHPRFDIQGGNNVMNLATKDWVAQLANIQIVSNLEEAWRKYKKKVYKHCKDQPNFKVKNQV
jgi:hypothetical protein